MATDPVCGMTVEEGPEALRLVRENRTYYFCSDDCRRTFAAPEESRRRAARRLAVAWPLSVAVFGLVWFAPARPDEGLAAVLAGVVQVYAGFGFYRGAWDALRHRIGNMDLLIASGTTAAYVYSLAVLLAPGQLPSGTYFDASSLIIAVILTGNYLEHLTRRRGTSALRAIADLVPATVVIVDRGEERRVPVADLAPGRSVRVLPGERCPADGTVREGTGAVDESLLTGEPSGPAKRPGDRILAGARNLENPLVVEVTAVGTDTFVAQVGRLLEDAELARVPLQRRADRLASVFVPFVLALAVGAGGTWYVLSGRDLALALLVFVTVAVTACPCAFGLATPAALLVGTGRAAEDGILFRGEEAIERAARVDTVLLDKTGTLVTAETAVASTFVLPPLGAEEMFALVAGLEAVSPHPLARAVRAAAATRGVVPVRFSRLTPTPGFGVSGELDGRTFDLGRPGPGPVSTVGDPVDAWAKAATDQGLTVAVLRRDGHPVGAVAFQPQLAMGAAAAVAALRAEGYGLAVVTGDGPAAAASVGQELGISAVHADVRPEGKVAIVRSYQQGGRRVAFVGDGVNDAPALAAADLGVAVGTGSEVARETGQLLLVRPDLARLPQALRVARRTVARVRSNLWWAVGYNAVLLPVAAGVLVPVLGVGMYAYLPVLGATAMGLSSTTVLLNSLTLRRTLGRASERPPTAAARADRSAQAV